eukprot:scaffold128829_cov60-Phaeocystis_antarctica.AAC.1
MARASGGAGAGRARRNPNPRQVSAPAAERTRPDTGGWQNAASRLASRSLALAEPDAVCSSDLLSAAQLGLCDVRGGDAVRGGLLGGLLGGDGSGGGGGGGGDSSMSSAGRTSWLLGLDQGRTTTDQTAAMMMLLNGDAVSEGGGDGLRASVGSLGLGSESDDESSDAARDFRAWLARRASPRAPQPQPQPPLTSAGSEAEASETIASLRAGLRAQEEQLRGLLAARDVVAPRGWEASHYDGEGERAGVGAP